MSQEYCWERFTKTGNVFDYLNYILLAKEEISTAYVNENALSLIESKEGELCVDSISCNGNGAFSHTDW